MDYRVTLGCDIFCTIDALFVKSRSYCVMRLVPLTTAFLQSAEIAQVEDNLYLPAFLHSFLPSFHPSFPLPYFLAAKIHICFVLHFKTLQIDEHGRRNFQQYVRTNIESSGIKVQGPSANFSIQARTHVLQLCII